MNDIMPGRLKDIRIVFIAALIAVVLAVVSDYLYYSDLEWRYRTSRLDRKLIEKEKKAELILADIEKQLEISKDPSLFFHNNTGSNALQEDIVLLIYKDNRIAYWSDNGVAFPLTFEARIETHKPVFLSNGWFIPVHRKFLDYEILALINVYRQYPIANSYLRSGFPEHYMLPSATQITFDQAKSAFRVTGKEKEFHFGLVFPEKKPNTPFIIVPIFFWFFFLLLLIRLVVLAADGPENRARKTFAQVAGFAALLLVYVIILITGLPPSVKSTELFSPFFWSAGSLFPSVGHLALLGLFLTSGVNIILRNDIFNSPVSVKGLRGLMTPLVLMITGFILFLSGEVLFRDLVLNSAISFEAYKILGLSFMSLAGFISVLLILSLPIFFFLRAFRMMAGLPLKTNLEVTGVAALVLPAACLTVTACSFWGLIYIVILAGTMLLWQRKSYSLLSLIVAYAGL
ncbi:MAG: hypothetical protein WCD55_08185, partial [Bacteroidales bacterium]